MGNKTFKKGGVHPHYDGKDLTREKSLVRIAPQGEFVFSLSSHIGAPAECIVNVGDHVRAGQIIGKASGFVSSNVYSSVSGTVKAIDNRINTSGSFVKSIVVDLDEVQEEIVTLPTKNSLSDWSKEEIVDRVGEAGIVGMGGAGFPTQVKLKPQNPEEIEYILVNAAECEPYITVDYRRMIENPEELVKGLLAILKVFPNAKGIFGIEDNKPEAISSMLVVTNNYDNISVVPLKTKYPQGGERQLIEALTGRKINSKKLPAIAGCIVDNVETIYAVYEAVYNGKPLIERTISVTGDGIADPSNFIAPIGMSQEILVEKAGGLVGEVDKIISGGPMMGFAMVTLNTPVTKTSSSVLVFKDDIVNKRETTSCINCGRCVEACPISLVPCRLNKFSKRDQMEEFYGWNGVECIECGCCSYVCPANIPLKQSIANMKRSTMTALRSGDLVIKTKGKKKNKKEKEEK